MPISWNEIRHNAVAFSRDWATAAREEGEAQTFWNEFFDVFGLKRRTVASFEESVKKISGQWGYIDLIWPGTLIVEHKSRGKPLDKAHSQALEYIRSLKDGHRDAEIPRYVIVSDFASLALHDLEEDTTDVVKLPELYQQVDKFAFIPGKLVYNNYPWPEAPTDKQKTAVEQKAQAVLDVRAEFPDSSLADLYDPLTMPAKLAKAHAELDRTVDLCYRPQPFESDRQRVEFLFGLYEKLTSPLTAGLEKPKRRRRRKG